VTLPGAELCQRMLEHARGDPAREVCGLIGAHNRQPCSYYPVANVSPTPARAFVMDPEGQIDALRRMRDRDEVMFGIFHSHPDGAGRPSPTDLALAAYPDMVYYIAAVNGTDAELHGWFYDGHGFSPLS